MFSIWDLIVNQIAGSFFIGGIILIMMFAIILAIGGVSFFSSLLFTGVFIFAMALGYGYTMFFTVLAAASFFYFMISFVRMLQRSGG